MLSDPQPKPKPARKNPLLYSSVAIAIALLYAGWVLFSRWHETRAFDRKAKEEAAQKQRENDRASVELLGGNDFAIQMFYASPGVIQRGDAARAQCLQLGGGIEGEDRVHARQSRKPSTSIMS